MFRKKELVQQTIHLEQAIAIEPNTIPFPGKKTPIFQCPQRGGETLPHIHSKLRVKVRTTRPPELQLEHELTYQALVLGGRERAINGQLSIGQRVHVGLELVLVLIMRSPEVPERCHAQ